MDVAFILDKYFNSTKDVSIDVFDAQSLNTVYQDVVNSMTSHLVTSVTLRRQTKTSMDRAIDDIKHGRVYEASSVEDLIKQCKA